VKFETIIIYGLMVVCAIAAAFAIYDWWFGF